MLRFTPGELELAVVTLVGAVIGMLVAGTWIAWRQEVDIRHLRAAHERLRDFVLSAGDDEPGDGPDDDLPPTGPIPLPVDPPTTEADPVDTWARKAGLLARYSHPGQHRR